MRSASLGLPILKEIGLSGSRTLFGTTNILRSKEEAWTEN